MEHISYAFCQSLVPSAGPNMEPSGSPGQHAHPTDSGESKNDDRDDHDDGWCNCKQLQPILLVVLLLLLLAVRYSTRLLPLSLLRLRVLLLLLKSPISLPLRLRTLLLLLLLPLLLLFFLLFCNFIYSFMASYAARSSNIIKHHKENGCKKKSTH